MPPKKHAKPHPPKHEPAKDLRRAYEHLGRVEALQSLSRDSAAEAASRLVQLAKDSMEATASGHAADLLRAAEHLSFAALPSLGKPDPGLHEALLKAVHKELDKLSSKAEDRWADLKKSTPEMAELFHATLAESKAAVVSRRYRQALELARAAEALTHVDPPSDHRQSRSLPTPADTKKRPAPPRLR